MATTSINTSKAKEVTINLKDIDNLTLSFKINDISQTPKVAKDLTSYGFDFILQQYNKDVKTYSIATGATTSQFLQKTGAGTTVMNMRDMWEDIRSVVGDKKDYELIMKVTQPDTLVFVYLKYLINASKY